MTTNRVVKRLKMLGELIDQEPTRSALITKDGVIVRYRRPDGALAENLSRLADDRTSKSEPAHLCLETHGEGIREGGRARKGRGATLR